MIGLHFERTRHIATVTIDRPPVNALSVALCDGLRQLFIDLDSDDDTRCVILTGAGTRAFCAGFDFRDFLGPTETPAENEAIVREMYAATHHCSVPVIAAVNGPARGAGSVLACACDIRIASERASFGMPEIDVGRIGGAAHHGRLVAQGAVRRLAFTGVPISAAEAFRIGLVDQVVADALSAARDLAAVIASKSRTALQWTKQSLNQIEGLPFEEGYRMEQATNAAFRQTAEAVEAARALVKPDKPESEGH